MSTFLSVFQLTYSFLHKSSTQITFLYFPFETSLLKFCNYKNTTDTAHLTDDQAWKHHQQLSDIDARLKVISHLNCPATSWINKFIHFFAQDCKGFKACYIFTITFLHDFKHGSVLSNLEVICLQIGVWKLNMWGELWGQVRDV